MKILMINGSPKISGSASGLLLDALRKRIGDGHRCVVGSAMSQYKQYVLDSAYRAGAIVFVFPLYVDGIPSLLLRMLEAVQHDIATAAPGAVVYVVVNNGFYEGRQNAIALEMMRSFCRVAGLTWGQGLGIGGSGMTGHGPEGKEPAKSVCHALDALAARIVKGETAADCFLGPHYPRFFYRLGGGMAMRSQARKYGVKGRALRAKPGMDTL